MCGERYCLHWRWIAIYPQGLQSSWCLGLLVEVTDSKDSNFRDFSGGELEAFSADFHFFFLRWVIWKVKKTCWQSKLCGNNPTIFGWIRSCCSFSLWGLFGGPTSQRVPAIDVPLRWYHRARPQQWGFGTSGHLKVGSGVEWKMKENLKWRCFFGW